MPNLTLLILKVFLLVVFVQQANADKAITFYYRATTATRTMTDGTYQGDNGKTALQQQQACLEYVKSLFPHGTNFLHLSCTPASALSGILPDLSGPWGEHINQNGKIHDLQDEKRKLGQVIEKIKSEVDRQIQRMGQLVEETVALNARIENYRVRCEVEIVLPDEQAKYEACVQEYGELQQMDESILSRESQIQNTLRNHKGEIDAVQHKLSLINRAIGKRERFQQRAPECGNLPKQEAYDCLKEIWNEEESKI